MKTFRNYGIAICLAGVALCALAQAARAAPATITDPSGVGQATVNAADKTLNVRALATPQAVVSARKTVTTSAAALSSAVFTNGVILRALSSNAASVCIGGSGITTSNGYCLAPGEAISYGAANANQIYIIGANTSDVVMYTGN